MRSYLKSLLSSVCQGTILAHYLKDRVVDRMLNFLLTFGQWKIVIVLFSYHSVVTHPISLASLHTVGISHAHQGTFGRNPGKHLLFVDVLVFEHFTLPISPGLHKLSLLTSGFQRKQAVHLHQI